MSAQHRNAKFWDEVEVIGDEDAPKYMDFNKQYFHSKKGDAESLQGTSVKFPKAFWAEFQAWFSRQMVYPNYSDFIRDWVYKGFAYTTSKDGSKESEDEIMTRMLVVASQRLETKIESQKGALDKFRSGIQFAKETQQPKILAQIKKDLEDFISKSEGRIKSDLESLLRSI